MKLLLQPKQRHVDDLLNGSARWIGEGGGRGCAKSYTEDALMLKRRGELPGTVGCIVMRNYDQVRKYHIEPMLRNWPELRPYYNKGDANIKFPAGAKGKETSQIDFSYGDNLQEIERRFRSANYYDIFVDQAEQFLEDELREMNKACRWPGVSGGKCKMLLAFNMGGAGIQSLKKWFHSHEYGEREDPADYTFLHVDPWDNVEWARASLAEDGLSDHDYYYRWTDEQRFQYFIARTDWGKSLNAEDDAIRNRDLLGSWESLEGAYFGRVFDRRAMLVTAHQVGKLLNYWDTRWMSTDWGKAHFCVSYWHAKANVSPAAVREILGWDVEGPLSIVVTYRECVVNEMASPDVAARLVSVTPEKERSALKRYFLSPDAFGERDSSITTAASIGKVLREAKMPQPEHADTDRAGGARLMYDLMTESKRHGSGGGDVWFISAECPQLLAAIPVMMRDPKNLDDVLKTDRSSARIEQDCFESARYGLKSMLSATNSVPAQEQARRILDEYAGDRTTQAIRMQEWELKRRKVITRRPRWRVQSY